MSLEWIVIVQCLFNFTATWLIYELRIKVRNLENEKQERINYLTDPNVIDAELERSARRREAFDSKMPYPPREDSGPPAVVHQAHMNRGFKSPKKDG